MAATIHHLAGAVPDRADARPSIPRAAQQTEIEKWFIERMSAMHLHCEAASRWLDRPEPDILEARLAIEALRGDVDDILRRTPRLIPQRPNHPLV